MPPAWPNDLAMSLRYGVRVGRLRRDRGISVARPTPLGNPFVIGRDGERDDVLEKYRTWLPQQLSANAAARAQLARIVAAARLGDVMLLCWCAPERCHADIIAHMVSGVLSDSATNGA